MTTSRTIMIALAVLCVSTPAFAQSDEDKAFEHFDEGAQHYFDGEFRASIESFRDGFDLFAHPMFQVNIAISHWRLGELTEAIAAADLAWSLVDQLEPPIAAENAARRHTFSVIRTTRNRAEAIAADAAANAEVVKVAPAPTPAPERSGGLAPIGWAGVATAGVGVGLLAAWAVTEAGLSDDVRMLETTAVGGDRVAYNEAQSALRRKQTTARILLGVGAGLTAVGAGLLVFDLVRPNERTSVTVLPLSDGATVSAALQF